MSALFWKNYFYFFAWNSGAPALGSPLVFVHPAYPVVTPLDSPCLEEWQDI